MLDARAHDVRFAVVVDHTAVLRPLQIVEATLEPFPALDAARAR
jgi:hypothetical protein